MAQDPQNEVPREDRSEHINRMFAVTMPVHWLMLAGLFLVFSGFMAWACFGTLSRTVNVTALYHPGSSDYGEMIAMVPLSSGKTLDTGMDVVVNLVGYNLQEYGNMRGKVTYVDDYTATVDDMRSLFGNDLIVNAFAQNGPCMILICRLDKDEESANGFFWTNDKGKTLKLHDGTFASLTVIQETVHPITLGIPQLQAFFGK